jgi:hypothetical protein
MEATIQGVTAQSMFKPHPKTPRLHGEIIITEKIDGTNASVIVTPAGEVVAASKNRLITPGDDNYGFAAWVERNREDLLKLGPGQHSGEWWGPGIQRSYGLGFRKFSLFNVDRWAGSARPLCCDVVPVISRWGSFNSSVIQDALESLQIGGSRASPGFLRPEGVCVYHVRSGALFKAFCIGEE